MIKGVTFDLWDTMVRDESDEPVRAAKGLRSKQAERRHVLWQALNALEPIERTQVELAYSVGDAAFSEVWHKQFVTWTIAERLGVILKGLGRCLPDADFARVVQAHEAMEVEISPDLIEGIAEALEDLAGRYKLCVVSDTIVTSADGLRAVLEKHGLKTYFSGFAFSDEVGHSKPHRAMFDKAAAELGLKLEELVHIGDRDHNDVKGPQGLGMKAILFTAARAHDKDTTSAEAVCERHADLPGIIDCLAGR